MDFFESQTQDGFRWGVLNNVEKIGFKNTATCDTSPGLRLTLTNRRLLCILCNSHENVY